MARLHREFYAGDTVDTARAVLGKYLVRQYRGQGLIVRITEAEAYVGRRDRACHAYGCKRTPRTAVLFGPPGRSYLYFVYGMHWCFNLVTEPEGEPSAVLLRAGEAVAGTETIRQLRFGPGAAPLSAYQRRNFLNGPGKLCKGLSLSGAENGMDLTGDTLFLCEDPRDAGCRDAFTPGRERLRTGPRIGVEYAGEDQNLPWRFWLEKEE